MTGSRLSSFIFVAGLVATSAVFNVAHAQDGAADAEDAAAEEQWQGQDSAPEGNESAPSEDEFVGDGNGVEALAEEPEADGTFEGDTGSDGDVTDVTPDPSNDPRVPVPSSDDIRGGILDAHSRARAAVGLPPLTWSSALAAHAQEWTDRLASTRSCGLEHRSGESSSGYGENLFGSSGPYEAAAVVDSWDSEKANFNAAANTCAAGAVCGHYTQIVWRNTTEVGCAVSACPDGSQVWACNYNPAGNFNGERPF